MFTVTCNWTFLAYISLYRLKLDLLPFSFFVTFESDFDTFSQVPVTFDTYPQIVKGNAIR